MVRRVLCEWLLSTSSNKRGLIELPDTLLRLALHCPEYYGPQVGVAVVEQLTRGPVLARLWLLPACSPVSSHWKYLKHFALSCAVW